MRVAWQVAGERQMDNGGQLGLELATQTIYAHKLTDATTATATMAKPATTRRRTGRGSKGGSEGGRGGWPIK